MKQLIFSMLFILSVALGGSLVVQSQPAYAAGSNSCNARFLTFPTWYRGVVDGSCNIKNPSTINGGIGGFIWKIVLNIIEIALQIVVYICIGFIIYGGTLFLRGGGSSEKISAGKQAITNAIIGLIISILSVALVSFIAGRL